MVTTRRMTAEELADLEDDEYRYELVEGELRHMSPAGFEHGKVAARFVRPLSSHVDEHNLGVVVTADTGFRLARNPDTVLAPDVAFVRADRLPPPSEQSGYLDLAPDLVIEVVSPTDRASDVNQKVQLYLDAAVRLLWIAYPKQRTVMAFAAGRVASTLREGDTLDGGDVLPGFRQLVSAVFA